MSNLQLASIIAIFALSGCASGRIPAGYEDCSAFSSAAVRAYPTPSMINGIMLLDSLGRPVNVVQNGSARGVEFGDGVPVLMLKVEDEHVKGFRRAAVRATTIGSSDSRWIFFWSSDGGMPVKQIEIPAGDPEGVTRNYEYSSVNGKPLVAIGVMGAPSIVGAVCVSEKVDLASTKTRSHSAFANSLKVPRR